MTVTESISNNASAVRSLPQVVEELAQQYPDNTWMTLPLDPGLSGGWRNVTYKELALAVDGMLDWMKEALGDYKRSSDVAAYIGYVAGCQSARRSTLT